MTISVTQKTPDQAAALIQARVRGRQQHQREQRAIRGITRLQARQRGRYTRREYFQLLEFYTEQESFLQQTKQRQLRIWQHEQELYFLQHTTAEQLESIRAFQYKRSARVIQREWRRGHPRPLDPSEVERATRPFDPFGFLARGLTHENSVTPAGRSIILQELYGELPQKLNTPRVDEEAVAQRRDALRERVKTLRRERTEAEKNTKDSRAKPSRRELYEKLANLRNETSNQIHAFTKRYREPRVKQDLETAQVLTSCENRMKYLLDEKRLGALSNPRGIPRERRQQDYEKFTRDIADWSYERKLKAWLQHRNVLESVFQRDKWYQTHIAGEERDIRQVYVCSPWENEKQVWLWPPRALASPKTDHSDDKPAAGDAIERFLFHVTKEGEEDNQLEEENPVDETTKPAPLNDVEASAWWTAHCTQSHLGYAFQQRRRQREHRSREGNSDNNLSYDAQVTPEMVANPTFYALYQDTIRVTKEKDLGADVQARIAQLQKQIQRKVVEMETQVEVNTRLILEAESRKRAEKVRKSKETTAATSIQRHIRGKIGRKHAAEHRAQYFVMVRGRAIRKGKCEECGEQPAVLECKECEESLHFCPTCWVQVHSTRRRRSHIPIPMVNQPAPMPPRDNPGLPKPVTRPFVAHNGIPVVAMSENDGFRVRDAHPDPNLETGLRDHRTDPPKQTKVAYQKKEQAAEPVRVTTMVGSDISQAPTDTTSMHVEIEEKAPIPRKEPSSSLSAKTKPKEPSASTNSIASTEPTPKSTTTEVFANAHPVDAVVEHSPMNPAPVTSNVNATESKVLAEKPDHNRPAAMSEAPPKKAPTNRPAKAAPAQRVSLRDRMTGSKSNVNSDQTAIALETGEKTTSKVSKPTETNSTTAEPTESPAAAPLGTTKEAVSDLDIRKKE